MENSAAQESTRLYTGRTLCARRSARTAASLVPVSWARRASEKPARLSLRRRAASSASMPSAATWVSAAMISSIWSRNHGSM
ncbi:hypothetical protein D3C71_1446610 [compost metagenome]